MNMSNDLIRNSGNVIVNILKEMIKPEEVVEQISRKTTVKTDVAVHTVWEIAKKSGTAIFRKTKNL